MGPREENRQRRLDDVARQRVSADEIYSERVAHTREWLNDLQELVNNELLEQGSSLDVTLTLTLQLIVTSVMTDRPLFDNPMREPFLVANYLLPWVRETVTELGEANRLLAEQK